MTDTMAFTEIGHIVFAVRDLEANRSFYGEQLGLREIGRGPNADGQDGCCFSIGPSILEMRLDVEARRGDAQTGPPAEVNHMALFVDSMAATYAVLKDRDVPFKAAPHSTAIGHRNMQRTLVTFPDPNGFTLQISETIDPRPHHDARKAAKARMASYRLDGDLFGGIDHISTYCTEFAATRAFYTETLGLEEFFYNNKREEGKAVESGFEQAAFAIGGTDIELATGEQWTDIGPGPVRQLGLWSDDAEGAHRVIQQRTETESPERTDHLPLADLCRRAFTVCGPDGQIVQITQTV
jgi:catechol 2,3-dioxygenase-like lactoylglutathione lyase family enzyme